MNTKEKLMQLLELCIEKELNYEYSWKHQLIRVLLFDTESEILFNEYCYLDGIDAERKIDDLINKVENYQP